MGDPVKDVQILANGSGPPAISVPEDFSLVLGGPLYQLCMRAHLSEPAMTLVHRRILAAILLTWAPLAALAAVGGRLLENASVPFLFDVEVHVRFLIALPLLIGAELLVHRRIRGVVEQFIERGLILPEDRPKFDELVASAMRMRNSVVVELILLAISLIAGYWIWQTFVTLDVTTWYARASENGSVLTAAGLWYAFVSLPIIRFILLRWYYRLFIWYFFLWRVARLHLNLNPMHPDRVGGLAFLNGTLDAFAPILMAQTAFLAGLIGNQIWHAGATLPQFQMEMIAVGAFLMLVALAPLTFFYFHLTAAKRLAARQYGRLASRYVGEFREKWLRGTSSAEAGLLGSGDIQSLADLGNGYEVVRTTRAFPFDRGTVLRLAILVALPLAPLTLTMIPFEELVGRLIKLVL